jgi:hypothetical protein
MTTQLLIYENVVPLSRARHGSWSVEVADYSFSRKVNSVPLMAVEFPQAAAEYPIVFAGNEQTVMPVVVLGLLGAENMYVGADGTWQGRYVPAFVRRYPFVFSSSDDGKTFTLCIDESFGGFNQAGRGELLFDDAGIPTAYVSNVLKFLQEYQAQFRRTEAYCRKVKGLGLLESMQAQVTLPSGAKSSVVGFSGVSRDKLKALAGDALADLAKTDELELTYLQLQSMRNFPRIMERGIPGAKDTAKADAAAEATDDSPDARTGAKGRAPGRKK